jgi:hypothetical protein
MMDAAGTSEMPINFYQTAQCNDLAGSHLPGVSSVEPFRYISRDLMECL